MQIMLVLHKMTCREHVELVHRELQAKLGGKGLNVPDILDFGCGHGRLAFNFVNMNSDIDTSRVACVDQSVHHLLKAETEWHRLHPEGDPLHSRVKFIISSPDMLGECDSIIL